MRETEGGYKMERTEWEISRGEVFYSCIHDSCKEVAQKIFTWLGLHSIPELSSPGTQNVERILILQCDRGRSSDDISAVRNQYGHYHDKNIIIISLTIHDAEDHTEKYCTEDIPPAGNITFLKLHQRANGHIHECIGNLCCRDLIQSMLGITKENDDQSRRQQNYPSQKMYPVLKYLLLCLVLPFLTVFAFFVSFALSINNYREHIVSKTFSPHKEDSCCFSLTWLQCVLLSLVFPFLIAVSIVGSTGCSIGITIIIYVECLFCKLPLQIVMIKDRIWHLASIFWESVCCIDFTKTGSWQRML